MTSGTRAQDHTLNVSNQNMGGIERRWEEEEEEEGEEEEEAGEEGEVDQRSGFLDGNLVFLLLR